METGKSLIEKYSVQAPRYTSYPTVPYWDEQTFSRDEWEKTVSEQFTAVNKKDGISIYIHLPFCESLCTYCGCNTRITVNHKVEDPYIEAVLKEWQLYKDLMQTKPVIREIHLGGGTPTFFSAENLSRLLTGILTGAEVAREHSFSFEAHPNNTTRAHLATFYHFGFTRLSLGIQDFDPVVQRTVNRIQTFATVKQVTTIARETGYKSINYDLIYGLPFQTPDSVNDTIEKVHLLRPDRIALYSYAHVPWVKPGQRMFSEADLPAKEAKQQLYETAKDSLLAKGYYEIGMDHFALPGDELYKAWQSNSLHRNFMGYTVAHTNMIIGLGVSSISDSWSAFAQNVKKVETYYELLRHDQLPVFKGHMLSADDMILRKHILNLMCRMETSWQDNSDTCAALYEGIERLKEMEEEGLVTIEPQAVKVSEPGRAFIRNICMCLDARMWERRPAKQLFSTR